MLVHPLPDPVALSLGPLSVHWYGLMYLLAFAQFIALGRMRIRQPHIAATIWNKNDLDDMLFYGVLGLVIGGRLGEVLFYMPAYYLSHPLEVFAIWKGGMSFHGGFLGVMCAMALWAHKRRRKFMEVMDFIAPWYRSVMPQGASATLSMQSCLDESPTQRCLGRWFGQTSTACHVTHHRYTKRWATAYCFSFLFGPMHAKRVLVWPSVVFSHSDTAAHAFSPSISGFRTTRFPLMVWCSQRARYCHCQ